MCLLGEKTDHKDSPAYTLASIFSFIDSSATHNIMGDKDFGGSKKMITQGLDVYLYSKVNFNLTQMIILHTWTCYSRPINSVTRFPMNHYKPSTATSTRSFLTVTKSSFIMNSCCYLPVELTYTSIPSFLRQSTVGTTCSDKPSCQHL